jgi:hypothetical protein
MITFPEPVIRRENYPAFRNLIRELPDSYERWLDERHRESANEIGHGHAVERVQVEPIEFANYLAAIGEKGTYHLLRNFAANKQRP